MLTRVRSVLSLLSQSPDGLEKIGIVKLLFLAENEIGMPKGAEYEFVPFHRGPYSFTFAHDLAKLVKNGLVDESDSRFIASPEGRSQAKRVPVSVSEPIERIWHRYGKRTSQDIVDLVYDRYPWYTMNSVWPNRRRMPRPLAKPAVYTIGYESVQLDGLLNRLLEVGIQTLIDVRRNPVARRFGFHKGTLQNICPQLGIQYVHMPELGIPGSWRTELRSSDDYRHLFKRYEVEILPERNSSIKEVSDIMKRIPTALMCKEVDPVCCHRTSLANQIAQRVNLPVQDVSPGRKTNA